MKPQVIPVAGLGLVPRTYKELDKPRMGHFTSIDVDEAEHIFGAFDAWLAVVEEDDLGWFALRYAESGLVILIAQDHVAELRNCMASQEAFQEKLDGLGTTQDAFDNMEI